MRRLLLASVALTALAVPAHAQVLTSDIPLTMQITRGFTQLSNYIKGQMYGIQRTEDASNMANARFRRDIRNAEIRDEHVPTPTACETLDNSSRIAVASGESWVVRESLNAITDPRGEALPGSQAYMGSGPSMAAHARRHIDRYCNAGEARDGICAETPMPNADQRASSLLGGLSFGPVQERVDAAVDYAAVVTQPVPLGALRGAANRAHQGTEVAATRRWYNAVTSMARFVFNDATARRVETVDLTPAQQEQMRAQGMTPTRRGSWMLATELDIHRRAGTSYAASLQKMPPGSRLTESVQSRSTDSMVAWQTFKLVEQLVAIEAAKLAHEAEKLTGRREAAMRVLVPMPTPQ